MLLGLCGFAGVGKDEVRRILEQEYGFRGVAFADRLRAVVEKTNPYLPDAHDYYTTVVTKLGYDVAKRTYPSIRAFLVKLANAAREELGDSTWVEPVLPLHNEPRPSTIHYTERDRTTDKRVVVSDVRYANEARRVETRGGVVLRIVRPGHEAANDVEKQSLAEVKTPFILVNDGTLEELKDKVKRFMSVPLLMRTALLAIPCFYVATAYTQQVEAKALMKTLVETYGMRVSHDWTQATGETLARKGVLDYTGVTMASTVLVVMNLKDYAYKGTFAELGIALGRGNHIALISPFTKEEDAVCARVPFFHHPALHHWATIEDFYLAFFGFLPPTM
jgi:hypothetical protein